MENAMNVSKVRSLNENVPLLIELDDKRERYLQSTTMNQGFQSYAENIDVGSPIARYFYAGSPISNKSGEVLSSPIFKYRSTKTQHYCSRLSLSPLSSIENLEIKRLKSPPMYETRVKVEEEVFVMDDIQVRPMSGGKNGRSSSSSSPSTKSVFKTGVCRAWEESGNCRYNAKCQFSQGKEEFHPNRLPMKSKYEAQMNKFSPTSGVTPVVTPGVNIYGPNSRVVHELPDIAEPERAVTRLPQSQQVSPENCHADNNMFRDWSPLDDGIKFVLPNDPDRVLSREEVDAYILGTLNKRTTKRRLPVFEALCEGQ